MKIAKNDFIKSIEIFPVFVAFYTLTGLSPIWYFLGLHRGITLLSTFAFAFLVFLTQSRGVPKWYFYFSIITLSLCLISGIYWSHPRVGLYGIYFLMSLFIILVISQSEFEKFIDLSTPIIVALLIGAWVGTIYAFMGGEAIAVFQNPDSRGNGLFLSTLSNAANRINGNLLIRPAGIYDEPGTFSFIICALSTVRHFRNKKEGITLAMILMGFVTLSLAHFIFSLVYIGHLLLNRILIITKLICKKILRAILLAILISIFLTLTPAGLALDNFLLARLEVTEEGTIEGDNRSDQMFHAMEKLNPTVFIWGIDSICTVDASECSRRHGEMGNNPLSPLVFRGILVSLLHYVCLFTFLILGITRRNRFLLFGIFLLFLQRPSIMSPGYDIWAVAILSSVPLKSSSTRKGSTFQL